jgi:hypothetical protein
MSMLLNKLGPAVLNRGQLTQQPLKNASRFVNQVTKRNMATDPNAPAKVNFWEAPTDVAKWKEEHIVIAVLAGWGVVITGASKMFGGGKKETAK